MHEIATAATKPRTELSLRFDGEVNGTVVEIEGMEAPDGRRSASGRYGGVPVRPSGGGGVDLLKSLFRRKLKVASLAAPNRSRLQIGVMV